MDCSETWRRIEVALDTPTEAGERMIRLWSNLPEEIGAQQIAELYRARWRIEGMFQRLKAALHSEIRSLGRGYDGDPTASADRLLQLARNINPRQVATSKRGPQAAKPRRYVDGTIAPAHVSTTRVLANARPATP